MPKVSVILTSYNHARFIRESIESTLGQTFQDYELIIVDNASRDESWDIITGYKDPRINAVRYDKNLRVRAIYNGIDMAAGRYIAIHHSDDAWKPQKLEKQVAFLDSHPEYPAVFTNVQVIDEKSKPIINTNRIRYRHFDQPNRTRHEWLNYFFYQGNPLCHPSVLIRKECYRECGLYDYGFAQVTDSLKWLRLCLRHDIYILPEKLTLFRARDNAANASAHRPETLVRSYTEYFKLLEEYRALKDPDEFTRVFPEGRRYAAGTVFIPEFALAMVCLGTGTNNIQNFFGLSLLFDLVNDEITAPILEEVYHYTYLDLIRETGRHDIFRALPRKERKRMKEDCAGDVSGKSQENLQAPRGGMNKVYTSLKKILKGCNTSSGH